ncbi:MAG: DUF502 domain-containing protein [Bacteroidia bacterium]|nr:DUF502 domain-containing protein [Bacteroidia bacterium]
MLNYFLRGLLVLLPVGLTIGIIFWILTTLGTWLNIDGLGWKGLFFYGMLIIATILLVGFATKGVVANQIINFFEGIIEKAPGLNFIFGTTKDVTEAFVGDKKKFTEPVIVEMAEGVYKIGFMTQKTMAIIGKPDFVTVYLPFCYSLSGEMIVIDAGRVRPIDQESSHITKFVISGGVVGLEKTDKD